MRIWRVVRGGGIQPEPRVLVVVVIPPIHNSMDYRPSIHLA